MSDSSKKLGDEVIHALKQLHDGDGSEKHREPGEPHPLQEAIGTIASYAMMKKADGLPDQRLKEVVFTTLAAIRNCERCVGIHGPKAELKPDQFLALFNLARACPDASYDEQTMLAALRKVTFVSQKERALLWVAIAKFNRCEYDKLHRAVFAALSHDATEREVTEMCDLAEAARLTTALPGYLALRDSFRAFRQHRPECIAVL